jgi:shikimate kinase
VEDVHDVRDGSDTRADGRSPVRHVVIVGLMGSGNTTAGVMVARRLGWPVRDSDTEIEAREGRTVRTIRDERGTEALQELEARHLLDALATPGPSVICPAASVVDREDCLVALADPTIVVAWLAVSPDRAAERFRAGAHRPWYGDDPAEFLARQAAIRDPRFRAVATIALDAGARTPEDLAGAILEHLAAR